MALSTVPTAPPGLPLRPRNRASARTGRARPAVGPKAKANAKAKAKAVVPGRNGRSSTKASGEGPASVMPSPRSRRKPAQHRTPRRAPRGAPQQDAATAALSSWIIDPATTGAEVGEGEGDGEAVVADAAAAAADNAEDRRAQPPHEAEVPSDWEDSSSDVEEELQAPPSPAEPEILAACGLVARLLERALGDADAIAVGERLATLLRAKYADHWHPATPTVGSGHRCLHSSQGRADPVVQEAMAAVVRAASSLRAATETLGAVTIWVDPGNVSMRVGEQGGITQIFGDESPAPAPALAAVRAGSPDPSLSPVARPFSPGSRRRAAAAYDSSGSGSELELELELERDAPAPAPAPAQAHAQAFLYPQPSYHRQIPRAMPQMLPMPRWTQHAEVAVCV